MHKEQVPIAPSFHSINAWIYSLFISNKKSIFPGKRILFYEKENMDYATVKHTICPNKVIHTIFYQYLVVLTSIWIFPGMQQTAAKIDDPAQIGKIKSEEERLFVHLLEDYNPSARPILDSSKTVPVNMRFSLMHIQDLVSSIYTLYLDISI